MLLAALLLAHLSLGGAWAASAARSEADLLEAEVAFRLSARLKDAKTIEVAYAIAPGYYLYRERFGFAVEGAAVGKPALPRGKNKFDATFNKTMETYRGVLVVTLPLRQAATGAITLKVSSQGCADAGVCYPPHVQTVRLTLSSAAGATAQAPSAPSVHSAPGASSAFGVPGSALASTSSGAANLNPAADGPSAVPAGGPLPSALTKATAAVPSPAGLFQQVTSMDDVQQRVKAAGRVALLDFYADWCAPCKRMEKLTFSEQRVRAKLAQFAALQADVTRNTPDDKLLLKHYQLAGPPGIIFFDRNGQEMPGLRVIGFEPPEKFVRTLEQALAAR